MEFVLLVPYLEGSYPVKLPRSHICAYLIRMVVKLTTEVCAELKSSKQDLFLQANAFIYCLCSAIIIFTNIKG